MLSLQMIYDGILENLNAIRQEQSEIYKYISEHDGWWSDKKYATEKKVLKSLDKKYDEILKVHLLMDKIMGLGNYPE